MREPLGVGVGLGGELDVGRGVDGLGLDVLEELLGDELDELGSLFELLEDDSGESLVSGEGDDVEDVLRSG